MGSESILITALLVGLLGGVHCMAMCGSVVGSLTFSLRPEVQVSYIRQIPYQLSYNFGRITSYTIIGIVFGWLGSSITNLAEFLPIQQALQVFAGLFMIALGMYIAGWWNGIVVIERLGGGIWKALKPLSSKMMVVRTLPQALSYGFVWGWLPCGLVYSMLIMALSAGSAIDGGLVMFAFGLGTLPNLMLMGSFAFFFTRLSRNLTVRKFAGSGIILMGFWQVWLAYSISVSP